MIDNQEYDDWSESLPKTTEAELDQQYQRQSFTANLDELRRIWQNHAPLYVIEPILRALDRKYGAVQGGVCPFCETDCAGDCPEAVFDFALTCFDEERNQ